MDYYTYDFEPTPKARSSRSPLSLFLAALLGGVVALGGAYGFNALAQPETQILEQPAAGVMGLPAVASTPVESTPSLVGEAVIPSVVTVQVGTLTSNGLLPQGSGSGVVIDDTGYIVTNDHVAGDANAIRVVLSDGRIYDAELIGTDPVTDLALLKIASVDLAAIEFGSTDSMRVGDTAIAVGNPLGLDGGPSLTVGVLSAFGRQVTTGPNSTLYGMLQTDAPITQGSSGGALVDGEGRLIGITTAVGVSDVGIEGIGFATPIEIVERVIADLRDDGNVAHALLGINGQTELAALSDGGSRPTGVIVSAVEPGSAADLAGIQEGDVITSVAGVGVDTMQELISALRRLGAGEMVEIELDRNGATVSTGITLGKL